MKKPNGLVASTCKQETGKNSGTVPEFFLRVVSRHKEEGTPNIPQVNSLHSGENSSHGGWNSLICEQFDPVLLKIENADTVPRVFVVVTEVRKQSGGSPNGCDFPMWRHRTACAVPLRNWGERTAVASSTVRRTSSPSINGCDGLEVRRTILP
jgi:hypothetical protein